jgi:transposase
VRKECPAVIFELRVRAVEMKLQGHTHPSIAQTLDVSVAASRLWWKLYKEAGREGLELGTRGRPTGTCRTLTPRQERAIQKAITDKVPEQMKLPFALWTRPAIRQLIRERYNVTLPVRTLGHYLKRWGFTPQRPKKAAYEQQPQQVREWLDNTYPKIAKRAKAQKADILWCDETGVSNQDHAGRGYAPRGQTPVVRGVARRVSTSMISAIGNRGDARFMIYKGGLKAGIFLTFLKRLIKGAKRKIFLVLDNLRVHKSKAVMKWVEEHAGEVELHYLPAYSPELNPDEYLNNTMKGRMRNMAKVSDQAGLKKQLTSVMQSLTRNRELILKMFQHPNVAYAA